MRFTHRFARATVLRAPLALAVAVLLASCTEAPSGPDEAGPPTDLRLVVSAGSVPLSTLVVEVTGPGIDPTLVYNLQVVSGTASGTLTMPAGSQRTVTIRAYDAGGVETHRGEATLDVVPGTNPTITIVLVPLTGSQPVEAIMGSLVVIVDPAAATVAVGDTVRLTATIEDQSGDTIDGAVRWATVNPAIATVDTTGLVTGVLADTAEIVATYGGVAGKATVIVVESLPERPVLFVKGGAQHDIYAVDPDGSGLTLMAGTPEVEAYPAWSRDGTRFAFWRRDSVDLTYRIHTMNADGTNLTQLPNASHGTGTPGHISWSPDGDTLMFASANEIYRVNLDGTGLANVTNTAGFDGEPDWSPDGGSVVFYSNRDGDNEIYVMNPDGTGVTQLTSNGYSDIQPDWSPDGSKIAFVGFPSGSGEVHTMNADGSNVQLIVADGVVRLAPSWSPDGTRIAYYRWAAGDIYVMNVDGSGDALLADTGGDDSSPDWF